MDYVSFRFSMNLVKDFEVKIAESRELDTLGRFPAIFTRQVTCDSKGFYSKRKEFALRESKFFSFKTDPFSEGI